MNCFCLPLLLRECRRGIYKRSLQKEISPFWTPDVTEASSLCYFCLASLCLSSQSAPHYQMSLKGHYKKKKKASGITVGSSHYTYYKKSTSKCETKYRLLSLQPSSHHYFHSRSIVCWFPSACLNIFYENIVRSTGCLIHLHNKIIDTCSVSQQFSDLLWDS